MEAGRELDALVAEKVFGLPVKWASPPYIELGKPKVEGIFPYLYGQADGVNYNWGKVPHYSTTIADAWLVVEHLSARDCWLHELSGRWEESWRCIFARGRGYDITYAQSFGEPTPMLAICSAALEAVAS